MQTTEELVVGRELDALVAEKVMGWTWHSPAAPMDGYWTAPPGDPAYQRFGSWNGITPSYFSTDIAAAWQVVEHMRGRGCMLNLNAYVHAVEARFMQSEARADQTEPILGEFVLAETASLAICRAALQAVAGSARSGLANASRL